MCAATKADPCVLMTGPPPEPGTMPALGFHDEQQLRAMAKPDRDADPGVRRAAADELRKRGIET